jgi:hypothetical protein
VASSGVGHWLQDASSFTQATGIITTGTISDGLSSALAGGSFWEGARNGAISAGLNHAAHLAGFGDDPKSKNAKKPSQPSQLDINRTNALLGLTEMAEFGIKITQEGMLDYRQSLSVTEKIGTFARFKATYKAFGFAGKLIGGAGTYVAAPVSVYSDYQSMQGGEIGAGRFTYRTAGTAGGIAVGAYFGTVPAIVVGGSWWAGEKAYNGFMKWIDTTSRFIVDFNRAASNGWYPGKK